MNGNIKKIILVDDDEDDRFLFSEAFEELKVGAELMLFEDGLKLLDYLKEIDSHLDTYLFLDLNMPQLSGMECLKILRNQLKLNEIFVTIYSTSSSERDVNLAFENGANGYLKKPTSFGVLKDLIKKAIFAKSLNNGVRLSRAEFLLNYH